MARFAAVVQSVFNNASSLKRRTTPPVTAFTRMDDSAPYSTFCRSSVSSVIILSDVQKERAINIAALRSKITLLHSVVHETVRAGRKRPQDARTRGFLLRFTDGHSVLAAPDDLTSSAELLFR